MRMAHMRGSPARLLVLATLVSLGTGCAMNKTEKGAIIGAGAGGAAGAVNGNATGSTVRGAIIAATVGGVAGAVIGHQMDQQAEELAYELPGATVQRVGQGIAVTFPEGLLFGFDSDQPMPTARDNLRSLAASLEKYPNTRTLIVGHTDSDGSTEYNMDLSDRRAVSAANLIVGGGAVWAANLRGGGGIDPPRVCGAGRGEAEPIATNASDEGRRQNRRVEI